MNRLMLLFALPLLAVGCGTTTTPGTDGGGDMAVATGDMAGQTGDMAVAAGDMAAQPDMASMMMPKPPMLGAQIDRMGRPGVNTALTDPFGLCNADPLMKCGNYKGKTTDQIKDAYNGETDPVMWQTKFASLVAMNAGILDGLDGKCGNQAGFALAMSYATLAGALTDDVLFMDSEGKLSNAYLAVEVNTIVAAQGGMPPFVGDCGGRNPLEDTIDTTYSLLAAGVPAGVGDGVAKDADGTAKNDAFPFLDNPL